MARYATKPALTATVTAVAPNPKRKGSAAHARYAKYPAALPATVQAVLAIKNGPTMADLQWDIAHGFIKVAGTGKPSKPATTPAAPAATAPAQPAKG